MSGPRFNLGTVYTTRGALARFAGNAPALWALLRRHTSGDWGDFPAPQLNEIALGSSGGRVMSMYTTERGRVWIITSPDRTSTTVLLPEEYPAVLYPEDHHE